MTDNGFNIFYECAARSSPSERRCTSSWGDIKMYTSGSIPNLQRILIIEINESGAIVQGIQINCYEK